MNIKKSVLLLLTLLSTGSLAQTTIQESNGNYSVNVYSGNDSKVIQKNSGQGGQNFYNGNQGIQINTYGDNVYSSGNGVTNIQTNVQGTPIIINGVVQNAKTVDNGKVIAKTHNLEQPFTSLTLSSGLGLNLTVNPTAKKGLEILAEEKIHSNLVVEVKDRNLNITTKGSFQTTKPIKVTLSASTLEELNLGGAEVTGTFDNPTLRINSNGSGDINLKGKVDNLQINSNGSGDFHLKNLPAKNTMASLNGSGDMALVAKESANVSINGSGDIVVYGKPPKFSQRVMGSGTITQK